MSQIRYRDEEPHTNWVALILKILAYAIGLFLAGYGTPTATADLACWLGGV